MLNERNEKAELDVSLALIKAFTEVSRETQDDSLITFIKSKGLPAKYATEEDYHLSLYLHRMLVPFYSYLSQREANSGKVLMDLLNDRYYLLAERAPLHFNFNFNFIIKETMKTIKEEGSKDQCLKVTLSQESSAASATKGVFALNSTLITLGMNSKGRLDIYIKAHLAKAVIIYSGFEELKQYIKDYQQMDDDLLQIYQSAQAGPFTEKEYDDCVSLFVNGEKRDEWSKRIEKNLKMLLIYQNINDAASIGRLEKLNVQLLGHFDKEIRNEAVKYLNMIYDETTWQEKNVFLLENTKISLLHDAWTLTLYVKQQDFVEQGTVLCVNMPSMNALTKSNEFSWIKCCDESIKDDKYVKLTYQFGALEKCGYYDWCLMKFKSGRFSSCKIVDIKIEEVMDGKGRTIVYDQTIKDLSVHEVFCDLIKADIDSHQGTIIKRGNFKTLEDKLDEYSLRYINCLYIMGALERDNQIAYDEETGDSIDIGNTEASPMAITCRSTVSHLLGGNKAFNSLMNKAKKLSMKVILDSVSRISSSRANRRYKNILLHFLDSKGKIQICYGSDGQSVHYEDSAVLNYRKIESWNLLIQEMLALINKHKIDGLHLENCQAWPQMMEIDVGEMYRLDTDGKPAYSPLEILNGEIVTPSEESGYWNSDLYDSYANPFLVKITKEVWKEHPSFIFFGECWLNEKFNNRHCALSKSGIIPRMYTLPIIISELYGRKIQRSGAIEKTQPEDVKIFREWYTKNYKDLPEGAMLVQSSSGQVWPYPAFLFGRGNWSAVDLLFSLPDIPMTFMNEIDGEAYRVQISNVYETKGMKNVNQPKIGARSKSLTKLLEIKEEEKKQPVKQRYHEDYIPRYNLTNSIDSLINLSCINVSDVRDIKSKQERLRKELGPEFGFDLNQIKHHYDHRRRMRNEHGSLRRGKLIYLNALDNSGEPHRGVFAFARYLPEETGIFAINFTNEETNFLLDMSNIINEDTTTMMNFNSLCYTEDWISEDLEKKGEFLFLRELVEEHVNRKLKPYGSTVFGFKIIPFSQENYKQTMEKSISKMINDIKNDQNATLDAYQISLQLKEIIDKKMAVDEFTKWFNYIINVLTKYSLNIIDYLSKLNFLKTNDKYSSAFFKYLALVQEMGKYLVNSPSAKLPVEAAKILKKNQLGPICFVTPELGRWSTVGGLGVMVDELTQGLSQIGQEVICISPYYNVNRKGQTDYLASDPFNIKYLWNIDVQLDQKYTFGVHCGEGNGIKYYFLHNYKVFPSPYPDASVQDILRQICLMCKASLELLCHLKVVPAMVVTNDWFTGLTAAYSKAGAFGETFKGTQFFHICHNLEASYEGRLYPTPQEGSLHFIHQLNDDWIRDPYWKQVVINPSRCAIMLSDQWGTVSNSYKQELLAGSSINYLLVKHPKPFAFPNGIFKEKRLKLLDEKAGKDRKAVKAFLQKKYFGFKDPCYNIPIYSFVGRITQQKGVLLILDAVEQLVQSKKGQINILVGGMGSPKDPYCAACIQKINYLKGKYPNSFWADPSEFFTDGTSVNFGSDFGLMPSLFEPGGIVQHEFFIAGTPVIAYRTGGLKDTVFEFEYDKNQGNGITFDTHNYQEFYKAVERSFNLFQNKEKFEICRKNAFNSAIDVADVSRAWCREFFRLHDKIFYNPADVSLKEADLANLQKAMEQLNPNQEYIFERERMDKIIEMNNRSPNDTYNAAPMSVIIDGEIKLPFTFTYKPEEGRKKPSSVQICGSFDKWQVRHPLIYDTLKSIWSVTLRIKKGNYSFKYIVDGEWVVNPNIAHSKESNGVVNNTLSLL